jgi:hypothetical protein
MLVEESPKSGTFTGLVVMVREGKSVKVVIVGSDCWVVSMAAKSIGGGIMAATMSELERALATTLSLPGKWRNLW